jgi:hypothetical protein
LLGKHGLTQADAEVVGVAPRAGALGQRTLVYTLRIGVTDGSTVDVESQLQKPAANYGRFTASIGEVLPVWYDPKNPSKFKVDWGALRARGAEFTAEVAAESARQVAEGSSSNPKEDLSRPSIIRAKREGRTAEVERLTAMLADLESGSSSGSTAQ